MSQVQVYQIQSCMFSNNNDIDNISVTKQSFYKAICTCKAMGVLNAKLMMLSNYIKMRVGVGCHGNKVLTAKNHTKHYYSTKKYMY